MKRHALFIVVALAGAGAVVVHNTSCATAQAAQGVAANILLPVSEEVKLGEQMARQLEQDLKMHRDPQVQAYVSDIGNRIAAKAKKPPGIKLQFHVVDDDKTVNAFAIPGGHIYVYSGLIKAASDESELAGVIGHEIAHVTQRHIAERLVTQFGLQTVLGIALGQDPGLLQQIAAQVAGTGALLKFTRDQESEADAFGVPYMAAAGYDPMGMVRFFQKLQRGEGPGFLVFIQDHPLPSARIEALKLRIAKMKNRPAERNVDEYRDFKARV